MQPISFGRGEAWLAGYSGIAFRESPPHNNDHLSWIFL